MSKPNRLPALAAILLVAGTIGLAAPQRAAAQATRRRPLRHRPLPIPPPRPAAAAPAHRSPPQRPALPAAPAAGVEELDNPYGLEALWSKATSSPRAR